MEVIAFVVAVLFWWTFWNRLNRIMVAVELSNEHVEAIWLQGAEAAARSASKTKTSGLPIAEQGCCEMGEQGETRTPVTPPQQAADTREASRDGAGGAEGGRVEHINKEGGTMVAQEVVA